ncbi:thioredoxin domain-containing protein [Sulfuricurvum sp.]|uniref:thioredoxin domain-containing protein n=1 Tax=Sulfuricurvum sp. TaxID=2025608 RepID=UPI00261F56B1|nr:thioredoxin domain-containing protein [Sulfuricurvum sp.]MDD2266243.1 thioredoxin domain-containing protein [Sulfuricurvum sp.]MDD2783656.1 thioredoxin domain-containing protein [Sulfuricurvum sp.]
MSNRLALEDSPYLQQHKDNPLNWYPWCDEAFEKARTEHKAIFISIGYSSCHWCHVMEHEVFENSEIAKFVNQHFICIKVDREERPDIDKHYQELHTLLNRRSGGWPLSIFCTPQNKPFYAATYIPPYNRERMMGFSELTAIIAEKVAANDEKLFQNADEITTFLQPKKEPVQATALNEKIILQFTLQAQHNYDTDNGGFSKSPKFPHVSTLRTLMDIDRIASNDEIKTTLTHTLDSMVLGGMYDHIDGGFCRYSTDDVWLVPHFEKMTYDNALLCGLYAEAGILYSNDSYLRIARESADFMLRFMMEDNLFYSASDADSDGEEGKYFVYSYTEIIAALEKCAIADPHKAARMIGASAEGNFEGHCIIRFTSHERPEWFEALCLELRHLRQSRTYPFIDRKVITAWNAMMIKALLILGRHTPSYRTQAIACLSRLTETMVIEEQLKHSALIHKTPKIDAFLEDYAYLCTALIEAYQSTLEETYLIQAQRFANKALELYYEEGKWYFSRGAFTTIAELDDGTYPSAMAVMIDVLLSLGILVDPKYRHFAYKSLEFVSIKLMKTPIYYPTLTEQTIRYLKEQRLIKGSSKDLLQLCGTFLYPFVLLKNDETLNELTVCGENACFTATKDGSKLDELIASTL